MLKSCPEFARYEQAALKGPDLSEMTPDWRAHLLQCQDCRSQWEAHRWMRLSTAHLDIPRLSSDFNARLAARWPKFHPQPAVAALTPRARLWLQIYWCAVTLVAGVILAFTAWPSWAQSLGFSHLIFAIALVIPLLDLIPATTLERASQLLSWLE